tara:strand:+ start:55 stop:327 length:273 start_codon:yes stop_codon:yes gene_type:complete
MIENLQFIVIMGLFILFFLLLVGIDYNSESNSNINGTYEENKSLLYNANESSDSDTEIIVNNISDINIGTDNGNRCSQRKIDLNYMNKLV